MLLAALLSTGAVPVLAQITPAAPTLLLYENPAKGFSIEYPAAWIPIEENDTASHVIVSFVSLPETPDDQFAETVTVTSEELPQAMTLQQYTDIGMQVITSAFPNATIVEESDNATLAGNPAHSVVFDTTLGATMTGAPIDGRIMQIWTVADGEAFVVTFNAEKARYEEFVDTANAMFDSFALMSANSSASTNASNNTAIATTSDNSTGVGNAELDEAKQGYLAAWNNTQLQEGFSTFIESYSDLGYGVYAEHPSNIFQPGETISLYIEPVGFSHTPVLDEEGNTLYQMNLTASAEMMYSNGSVVATVADLFPIVIVSHSKNTELYLTVDITQSEPFPEGEYAITYTITDGQTGESFEIDKDIRIAEIVTT